MVGTLLSAIGGIVLVLGLSLATIGLYGLLRRPDIFHQLHAAGLVEIPRSGRSRAGVAFWGVLTGEAPDEVPVDIDEERDVLIVQLVDATDPDGVRERHREAFERSQGKVVP